ncbi:MAG TPA: multiheme c-type cytochrome [Polyangiaceae bacterium]|nr:multiheme c-type cytochrome [Polyangiaceae bacterium]
MLNDGVPMGTWLRRAASLALLGTALGVGVAACRSREPAAAAAESSPTLRLYVVSTVAGALDPCGCTKDQLGGADHAAAFIAGEAKRAPHALVVGAGPMLFLDPKTDEQHATQDLWKAEALAGSLADMGLVAWAPGYNDWAEGAAELARLRGMSHADLLAGNLRGDVAGAKATRIVEVNGYRVGLAGISEPKSPLGVPKGVEVGDAKESLAASLAELKKAGAQIFVALVAADRGLAMRLAELVPGYHAVVVGKAYEQGDGNDAAFPPADVGGTLVVQGPNHLQGVVVVDLFVRGPLEFKDGSGLAVAEKRQSLQGRIRELRGRISDAESRGVPQADVTARKKDLADLERELGSLAEPAPPKEGSFFRYRAEEVREGLGSEDKVRGKMADYYQRVNDHNREAFKDRLPPAPRPGDATYIGSEACSTCHDDAFEFWKNTPHARAYVTLQSQHKEFNLDCVSCHVTGYEKPGGTTVTHVKGLEAVQCEVCHGPGSRHEKNPADATAIVRSPPKTLCAPACHHPPHVHEGWDVESAWKIITGKGHGQKS